ncbi:MAG: CRISPR-associated protein [Bacteroidia bacterium]|nr:CRISPR-associated protein [Bacteroidia bacterium]
MLINFSNHPFSNWPQNQKELALNTYGEVVDVLFPNINPDDDQDELLLLGKKYVSEIKSLIQKHSENVAIHIMGELTFTYIMVALLQKENIDCVASTTRRITKEIKTDDKIIKTSEFQFIRFRKYPRI